MTVLNLVGELHAAGPVPLDPHRQQARREVRCNENSLLYTFPEAARKILMTIPTLPPSLRRLEFSPDP